jgi:hypothetical protein
MMNMAGCFVSRLILKTIIPVLVDFRFASRMHTGESGLHAEGGLNGYA